MKQKVTESSPQKYGNLDARQLSVNLGHGDSRGHLNSVPGGVQGQVGWGPGQPGLVLDVEVGGPSPGRGLELDDPWGPLQPKPFYDSMFLITPVVCTEITPFCVSHAGLREANVVYKDAEYLKDISCVHIRFVTTPSQSRHHETSCRNKWSTFNDVLSFSYPLGICREKASCTGVQGKPFTPKKVPAEQGKVWIYGLIVILCVLVGGHSYQNRSSLLLFRRM